MEIWEDRSGYGMPICEEFEEVLMQDELAGKIFERLTSGKQRKLIHIAGKPKNYQKELKNPL